MNNQATSTEIPQARAVSSEIKSILDELDNSEFVHAQENLSRQLDKIHSELGKIEMDNWLGSNPKLHIERMLGDIIGERLDAHFRSIQDTLHEVCVTILVNSREIQKMTARFSDAPPKSGNTDKEHHHVTDTGKEEILAILSTREREVVDNLLSGMTNREIAERLKISERTVKNHLWKVYKKLEIDNRTQLFSILTNL